MVGRPIMDAPGYKVSGYHTKKEFLDIVRHQHRDRVYYRMRGDPPGRLRKDDIAGWTWLELFIRSLWQSNRQG